MHTQRVVRMHTVRTAAVLVLTIVLGWGLAPPVAHAIPPFARAYDVPCSTCHNPTITRRSEFGDVIRKQGYHWPDWSSDGVRLLHSDDT